LSTNAAGPSLRNVSKAETIGKSETDFTPVLRSLLVSRYACHILAIRQLPSQTTAVCLGRKMADLVHLSEIFRAFGKQKVSLKPRLIIPYNRKAYSGYT
jgi:hypothetical protein